jgi:hypothetical protein
MVTPFLGTVIQNFLTLLNEFDNQDLVDSFEHVMQIFNEEMKPYAVQICTYLKDKYVKTITDTDKKQHKDEVGRVRNTVVNA